MHLRLYICIVLVQSYPCIHLMFLTVAGTSGSRVAFRPSARRTASSLTYRSACTLAAYVFCKKMESFAFQTATLMITLKKNWYFKINFHFRKMHSCIFTFFIIKSVLQAHLRRWSLMTQVSTFYVNVTLTVLVGLWPPKTTVEKNQDTSFYRRGKMEEDSDIPLYEGIYYQIV